MVSKSFWVIFIYHSVTDPRHEDADPDPDPTDDADLDPAFYNYADPC